MPLSAGDKLGPYEILSLIGQGGMGQVYKARDTRLGRIVAIKKLKGPHTGRFEQEARAVAALNHPNICILHDIGPDYLVMEYIAGAPLKGPLPLADALRFGVQIASALETAHGKGILHRDLKPANIMISDTGAKLLDFGLAKFMANPESDATQTLEGAVMGTAAYMSPEQAQGMTLDARSDVFSFGCVLYEMLSGARAFQGISMAEILSAVMRDEPAPLPSAAFEIVKQCLAKRPADRFQSIAEVRAALEKALAKPADRQPSIAVLPFANMSRDADDEYFSDGLAEEIINLLVHVPGLKVTARTSAFAFRGIEQDITKIAAALNVRTILEGSVRRAGNRIRVTAQLINAEDGYHLWSERYDRELTGIFALQDEIAAAIAAALQLKLSVAAPARQMPNLAAYEAYLKYRTYQWRFTPEESRKSRECLEQALALDPQFALPYVGLADFHLALFMFGALSFQESMPRARQLAQRALELDPDLTEAHGMLGIVAAMEFDWPEATRRFRTVMARQPVTPHVRAWYAIFYLLSVGRAREALEQMESVLRDDPYCQMWHFMNCGPLHCLGLEEAAIAANRKASELDPQLWVASMQLGVVHAGRGRYAEARVCAEAAFSAAPWSPYCIGLMAGVLRNTGEAEKAEELIDKLRGDAYGGPAGLTCYHFSCGEIDSAVEWAGKAVEQRFSGILSTMIRPFESRFSESAGWPGLLRKMNLPLT